MKRKANKTSFKPGESGNPKGRPRRGECLIDALNAEFKKDGNAEKLAEQIRQLALQKKTGLHSKIDVCKFLHNVYQGDRELDHETRLIEIEKRLEEVCKSKAG
jgi:hypothetical protein